MKRTLLVTLVVLGSVSVVRAAAGPSPAVLALTGGTVGAGSRLVALDPRTLEPRGEGGLALPGWAFGREWTRSPDRGQIALVPKPSETNEQLFVIGIRGSLRVVARLSLPGEDVCRLAWPSAGRLVLVLTRGPACYTAVERTRVLVVDPLRGRVVATRPLSGRATVVAAAPTRDGLALLLAPPGRRSGARLVVAAASRTRTVALPRLDAAPTPLDKSVAGGSIGLAIDRDDGRAYVVEPRRVLDVSLASGRVGVHVLPVRKPASAAKGVGRPVVQALWLDRGLLAVTGVRSAPHGRLVPLGLRFLDTRSWRSRVVDPEATGAAYAGSTVLAFQPYVDRLGTRAAPIGLRGYGLDGSIAFRALAGQAIDAVRVQGRYAYAAGPRWGGISVVDVRNGQVEAPTAGTSSISPPELLAAASL